MKHRVSLAFLLVILASSLAWAQAGGTAAGGSIWGKVMDETGAVLPGVTVTVQGPSLMGVQTSVSNEAGVYRFPALPPGEFRVTFTLSGFSTLVRSGVTLAASFTATVDVQLKISTVAETVEVRGQSPVVDAVNARVQTSFTKDALASMPAARDMWAILSASPAVQMSRIDVGGSTAGTQTGYRAYGVSGQTKPLIEGIIGLEGNGSVGFYYDYGSFEEVNIQTAAQGAEMATPGVMQVLVSKSGGNVFHGDFYTDYENRNLQSRNLTDDQIARGVRKDGNIVWVNRDLNLGVGGPIKKDKVWFFGSLRN
ncbi:MAG: carboxypeptidase regulatory-like domain-containing protein, partial [Acidobacteria bacterium]|nr:carboxypeptidase regulatory-like domain-containing protein [Acidobacteriota bacterium]